MKVSNSVGDARFVSVKVAYAGGAICAIPGILSGKEAVLVPKKMYRAGNGDICYDDYGTDPTDEYAYWKVHAAVGTYNIILNIPAESTTDHQYKLELLDDLGDAEPVVPAIIETKTSSTGLISLASTITIATEKDYYLKLINTTKWSSSKLRSISIAPSITLDEEATSSAVIDDNDGKVVNVQLTRTFRSGMYNTICLPFAVSAAEMNRVFPGAVVKQLTSSSIEEGDFVLNLNFEDASSIEAGKPYLINPAADVTNPKFIGVTIDKTLNPTNTSRANFVGNFVAGTITANPNNLFLGANNTLYFPTQDIDILGMRAYFIIQDAPAGVIKRARIVENEQVATDIEIVQPDESTKQDNSRKLLINGQLIILRDGIQYNVMGARMK